MADPDRLLEKITKMLEKASSTEHEEEAKAFIEAAQRLAIEHSIDLARAQARVGKDQRQTPEVRNFDVWPSGKQGGKYMVRLYSSIAWVNDVKHNVSHHSDYVVGFGFPSDLNKVEQLFTVLSVQMVAGANADLKAGKHRTAGPGGTAVDARVYRGSFYDGFISSIYDRLKAARDKAIADDQLAQDQQRELYVDDLDGPHQDAPVTGAELVLAEKKTKVEEFYKQRSTARGSWRPAKRTATVGAATRSGRVAGDNAKLRHDPELPGPRQQLAG